MEFSAIQIAQLINGTVEGDPNTTVNGFGKIEEAGNGDLTFFANAKYEHYLYTTKASVVILNEEYVLHNTLNATLIRVPNAYQAFATLLEFYNNTLQSLHQKNGIEQPSFIHDTAELGSGVYIGAFAYIGNKTKIGNNVKIYPNAFIGDHVIIDDDSTIYPHVCIYHDTHIGKNVIIHSGSIIGADGFGFAPQADGTFKKVPQLGNVVIKDHVEIGSNTTIDRATMGSTIIKSGAKLDNLIQIAHNVQVGANTVIAAQTGISGSTKLGSNCMVGGQVGIVGHLTLADETKINAQSGVTKSITEKGKAVTGSPAFDYTQALRTQALTKKLPDLLKRIEDLEAKLAQLL
jgi:UDP-3-O-[3-hydroxymyristoyl] glucosamine N-acyltransferase